MTKVLIVEDEPLVIRMYQKAFEFDGFEVVSAIGGKNGIELAKKEKPDLIIMDIMMPGMNGIEALEIMKSDAELLSIPVLMLTNLSGRRDVEIAKEKGALDFLVKSDYKPKKLSAKVKEILGDKREGK